MKTAAFALLLGFACALPPRVVAETAATNAPPAAASAPANPAIKQLEMLKAQPLEAKTIFSGANFPKIDLLNRELIEAAVGPITQQVRFFDAQWNEVTAPAAPGRYGALITFTAPNNLTWTQRLTLYKTPKPYLWSNDPYPTALRFPAAFGISPYLADHQQWNAQMALDRAIGKDANEGDNLAKVAAALQDLAADPTRFWGFSYYYIDRAWWAELGRRLGENQDYKYLSYVPDGYDKDPKKTWPLLVFLHGSGERGDDLELVKRWGPLKWIENGHPQPLLVIEPQCPEDEWWDPQRLARLIDQVSAAKRVDPKRIYVTGLSMGGFGAIEFAAVYPKRVAAIAPLSGGENPALAPRLKTTPAWIFHGAVDDVVPARESIDLARALQRAGAPVTLTIYPGVGHGGWDKTYSDRALYAWFLAQSK